MTSTISQLSSSEATYRGILLKAQLLPLLAVLMLWNNNVIQMSNILASKLGLLAMVLSFKITTTSSRKDDFFTELLEESTRSKLTGVRGTCSQGEQDGQSFAIVFNHKSLQQDIALWQKCELVKQIDFRHRATLVLFILIILSWANIMRCEINMSHTQIVRMQPRRRHTHTQKKNMQSELKQ